MFESQELVAAHLLFEVVADKMQPFFDLLHILFEDPHVFFHDRDISFQLTDRFKGFVALLAGRLEECRSIPPSMTHSCLRSPFKTNGNGLLGRLDN
jgi:hypothetical protein